MSSQHPLETASARQYASAYARHYTEHDLLGALQAYGEVLEQHPNAPEAEYSRSQMRNIARSVIPARELLTAQVDLARLRLQSAD
jgi:hypothetical protein